MKKVLFVLSTLIVISANSVLAQNVGEPLPDFTLNRYDGGTYKLSDQKGKVVLIFMFGYACPYCLSVGPDIQSQFVNAYASNVNYTSFGIDTWNGTNSGVSSFQKSTGLTMPLLAQGSSVATSWQTTYDRLLVVDAEGILVYKGTSAASNTINQAKTAVEEALSELTTATDEIDVISTKLLRNYPNPFSAYTNVSFSLGKNTSVSFDLFDITGRNVRRIPESYYSIGKHEVRIQREKLKAGIYYIRMNTESFSQTRKVIIQ